MDMGIKGVTFGVGILLATTTQVSAAISSSWLDYLVGKIGKPGSGAFEVMIEDGLILSRLKSDYAAFSLGETRLNDAEKLSEPVDVSEFSFVAEYEVCGDAENFFNNTIYKLNYRYHSESAQDLVDEILDINAFFNRVRGDNQPVILESTETSLVTSYLLGLNSIQDVVFQSTISNENQYIEISVTADSVCNTNN
tara:strand:- start:77 stop:661 length:585 start_codon:yes stop_codon:yes gene_type:complete